MSVTPISWLSSTAIKAGNVEVVEARRRGIPVLSRADLLAAICARCRTLAVSGTHGKTTTTAMLAAVLDEAGFDPSYLVGGELPGGRGGAFWSGGPWLVVEADEADGTFLRLGAQGVIVTNVEPDHLDYFGDEMALASAFERFVSQAPGPRSRLPRRQDGVCTGRAATAGLLLTAPARGRITRFEPSTWPLAGRGSKCTLEERASGASS